MLWEDWRGLLRISGEPIKCVRHITSSSWFFFSVNNKLLFSRHVPNQRPLQRPSALHALQRRWFAWIIRTTRSCRTAPLVFTSPPGGPGARTSIKYTHARGPFSQVRRTCRDRTALASIERHRGNYPPTCYTHVQHPRTNGAMDDSYTATAVQTDINDGSLISVKPLACVIPSRECCIQLCFTGPMFVSNALLTYSGAEQEQVCDSQKCRSFPRTLHHETSDAAMLHSQDSSNACFSAIGRRRLV